jgi:F0F1-type ATP synthase membrane subunit a
MSARSGVNTYTPLIMMLFLFIVTMNAIGLLPDLRHPGAAEPHGAASA